MPRLTRAYTRRVDYEEAKARYAELAATVGEASLKGAKIPYTSMNGNMYSYLGENGVGLRLPADVRESRRPANFADAVGCTAMSSVYDGAVGILGE